MRGAQRGGCSCAWGSAGGGASLGWGHPGAGWGGTVSGSRLGWGDTHGGASSLAWLGGWKEHPWGRFGGLGGALSLTPVWGGRAPLDSGGGTIPGVQGTSLGQVWGAGVHGWGGSTQPGGAHTDPPPPPGSGTPTPRTSPGCRRSCGPRASPRTERGRGTPRDRESPPAPPPAARARGGGTVPPTPRHGQTDGVTLYINPPAPPGQTDRLGGSCALCPPGPRAGGAAPAGGQRVIYFLFYPPPQSL